MENSPLDDIFRKCPRFRILTSGKTGVGKTTLIKHTFGIEKLEASDKERGKCEITDELFSPQNDRFVLHDSQGFEPGEIDNFNVVKSFIEQRTRPEIPVKDQLHAVWLCVQIPFASSRLLEVGDEELLKLQFANVPVVIVFTQYDKLYNQISYELAQTGKLKGKNKEEKAELIEKESNKFYHQHCEEPLAKILVRPKRLKWLWVSNNPQFRDSLSNLVSVTEELVHNHVEESLWIVTAAAQRVNADTNVKSCIAVGMKKYWRGLAAGTYFSNRRLGACIDVIHKDIVNIWNFRDDDQVLHGAVFKDAILSVVQDLADPSGPTPGSGFASNLGTIKNAVDVATPIAGPLAPVVSSLGLSVMFVKWLSEMYQSTPGVLRCLMGYIVDVTIVLEVLFWFKVAQPRNPSLLEDDVHAAVGMYRGSSQHLDVHREIRKYVDRMTLLDHVNPQDNTHLEVEKLIHAHRQNLIDTSFSNATQESQEPTNASSSQLSSTGATQNTGVTTATPVRQSSDNSAVRPSQGPPSTKSSKGSSSEQPGSSKGKMKRLKALFKRKD